MQSLVVIYLLKKITFKNLNRQSKHMAHYVTNARVTFFYCYKFQQLDERKKALQLD